MRFSVISAITLGGALLSTAPAAYAGHASHGSSYGYGSMHGQTADCPPGTSLSNDGTCLMNSGSTLAGASYGSSSSSSYSSSSYSSRTYGGSSSNYTPSTGYSSSSSHTPSSSYSSSYRSSSACPTGSTRSADGICLVSGGSSSSYSSYSSSTPSTSSYSSYSSSTPSSSTYSYSSTPLSSYRGQSSYVVNNTISSTMSDSEADARYGSGSISQTYTDGSNTIVPFTTTSATLSNYRVPGMGSNEFLSPTECPVNVYNPSGAKVLGCYQVSKPAPVRVSVPSYHTVRVVRPIIYVRYPVPVAVPVNTGWHQNSWQRHNSWGHGGNWGHGNACAAGWNSRYGENWPGRTCGW